MRCLFFLLLLIPSLTLAQINSEDISVLGKHSGLDFSNEEVDLMKGDMDEYQEAYNNNREQNLANTVSPTNVFNPILPGFYFDEVQEDMRTTSYEGLLIPKDKNEIAFYNIGQLHELLRTGQISSVELTTFFINRIKKHNDTLQCVITLTEQRAMEHAKNADAEIALGKMRGPLHGIPYGAKDLLSVKNYKTTWGAMPFKDQVIDYDAEVIKRLDEAGAVLIAKTSLGALAWGDVWFGGTTKNPWNTKQGSSGSSAGSASGVAAGLYPFALGTETLGSIVSPSTVCGVTGLRPTFGRVSRDGAMALSWSMDKIGPITRNTEDAAIVLNALVGPSQLDPYVIDLPFNYNVDTDVKKLRIGYEAAAFENDYGFKEMDKASLDIFKGMNVELVPVVLPELNDITSIILTAEAAAAFDDITRSGKDDTMVRQVKNAWPNAFRAAQLIPAVEYINANRLRRELMEQMDALFQTVDVIIHPSWASSALPISNLTGHPCLVVPNGFSKEGTPTSISFMGDLFKEGELIALGNAFQASSDFHLKRPPNFIE